MLCSTRRRETARNLARNPSSGATRKPKAVDDGGRRAGHNDRSQSQRECRVSDLNYAVELTAPDIEPYRAGNTGVEYATTFAAAEPGPHVLVTAVTHGNEICG